MTAPNGEKMNSGAQQPSNRISKLYSRLENIKKELEMYHINP